MTTQSPHDETGASKAPDWLTTPIEFEESSGYRMARRALKTLLALGAVGLVWAAAMPIRELSLARGQLIPATHIRPVQHLEGGIVETLLAREGEVVESGQPLIRMNAVLAESELAGLRLREEHLGLLKSRMEALVEGKPLDFSGLGPVNAERAREHRIVHEARLEHRQRERDLLLARVAQRRAELAALTIENASARRMFDIEEQQLDYRNRLVAAGTAVRKQLLDAQSAIELARGRLEAVEGKLGSAQQGLAEAEEMVREADARAHKLWSEELATASSNLAEVRESIRTYADRVERLTVRAPTRGRVQQILQRSPGEVVKPGETVARIVPLDDALMAEVRVSPRDIAAVKVADKAQLKVSAFDPSRFGKIGGEVVDISPATFEDENRRGYYKVLIRYDPHQPNEKGAVLNFHPGMTVDAEIVSGAKSLLQYLLWPLSRNVDVAFSER